MGRTITEDGLYESAKNLLASVVVDGRAWPCANLSLAVGGFEEGVQGNLGIGNFLVRGDQAKAVNAAASHTRDDYGPAKKKRRIKVGGIPTFFGSRQRPHEDSDHDDDDDQTPTMSRAETQDDDVEHLEENEPKALPPSAQYGESQEHMQRTDSNSRSLAESPDVTNRDGVEDTDYVCPRCRKAIPEVERPEHDDFHFAQDLQNEHTSPVRPPPPKASSELAVASASGKSKAKGRGRPAGSSVGGPEKGQRKLAFG
jgi:DNA polymerase eta